MCCPLVSERKITHRKKNLSCRWTGNSTRGRQTSPHSDDGLDADLRFEYCLDECSFCDSQMCVCGTVIATAAHEEEENFNECMNRTSLRIFMLIRFTGKHPTQGFHSII